MTDTESSTNPATQSPPIPSLVTSDTANMSKNKEMPPPKRRKRSSVQEAPVKIAAAPQIPTALPPPLMTYPHLVPSYYPVYQHPYFLAVGPQPPVSPSLSPTLPSNSNTVPLTTTTNANPTNSSSKRILPKSPTSTATTTVTATKATSPSALQPYNIYPYAIQVSPQLHPTTTTTSPVPFHPIGVPLRHNSVATIGTTADEREQARKVSHSAIERRRRERINDKILQLRDLIPACSEKENLHKMTILQSAIDYIIYLKKTVEDLQENKDQKEKFVPNNVQPQTPISMIPKEVEPFTHQFSINKSGERKRPHEEDREEDDDNWSVHSEDINLPANTIHSQNDVNTIPSLKPMDIIQLNKKKPSDDQSQNNNLLPEIVIAESSSIENSPSASNADRNMNLENILC